MPVVIISPPTVDRGYFLAQDLHALGFDLVRAVGVGPEAISSPSIQARMDQRGAKVHSGAKLTPKQVACLISHQMAICDTAYEMGSEWTIILEDDALIDGNLKAFADSLSKLRTDSPLIVSLFSLGRVIDRNFAPHLELGNIELRPLAAPPASAVGYAINRSAVEVARRFQSWPIFTRADWPPWACLVRFYLTEPLLVAHREGISTMPHVEQSPRGARRLRRSVAKVLGLHFAVHPQSYKGNLILYVKHAIVPSVQHAIRRVSGPRTSARFKMQQDRIVGLGGSQRPETT